MSVVGKMATKASPIVPRLLCCILMFSGFQAFGQEIKVLVLDTQNGKAVRNAPVWVQFYDTSDDHILQRSEYKTGTDGVARFQLASPQPNQLTVSVSADSFCYGFVHAAPADILKQGAVSRCGTGTESLPTPQPAEVILLVHHVSRWQRSHPPGEKD